jgi:hypothetical protein
VKRDEKREADAEDGQRNEEVAVGEDAFYGCIQRHRFLPAFTLLDWRQHTEAALALSMQTA